MDFVVDALQRVPVGVVWAAVILLSVIVLLGVAWVLLPVLSDVRERRRKRRWYGLNRERVQAAISLESWELDLLTDDELLEFIGVLTEARGCHPSAVLAGKAQKQYKVLAGRLTGAR